MNGRQFVFRVDASLKMGSGHVMRCLTLADALTLAGAECCFICKEHPGHMIDVIRSRGHVVHLLSLRVDYSADMDPEATPHGDWLGSTQAADASASAAVLTQQCPDWLVVDHYGLDFRWEAALEGMYAKLLVIDDLAERAHIADVLLDQTYGRKEVDYEPWVPDSCTVLCGAHYALLRPDFPRLREYSIHRRERYKLEHLLITLGGVDKDNVTTDILESLKSSGLSNDCRITVVMGAAAPWLDEVRRVARTMQWPVQVLVNVTDMAQLMADSDLVIGAAGSTSWERCCLGVPTLMVVVADNQKYAAGLLRAAEAVTCISLQDDVAAQLTVAIHKSRHERDFLKTMSLQALKITDGSGCARVIQVLVEQTSHRMEK